MSSSSSRSPTDAAAPTARRATAGVATRYLAAFALLALLPIGTARTVEGTPPGALSARANDQLERLAERDGLRAPEALLVRNLSRYFVRYLLPPDRSELARVIGTAERITARAAVGLYRTLQAGAERSAAAPDSPDGSGTGESTVEAPLVAGMFARLLPSAATDYGETRFFADRESDRQLAVDTVDLTVFADTGFAWSVLSAIDRSALEADGDLPLTDGAIDAFHDGINAYALLLFRIAGLEAKRALAPHVESRHLRAAAAVLAEGELPEPLSSARERAVEPDARSEHDPFTDVTDGAGLHFRHVTSDWLAAYRRYGPMAPSFSGGGVTAGDFSGDGHDDLIVCGGRGCAAFENRRDGSFADVTAAAGIQVDGEARMALLADFDNDGDRDLFVTYARDSNRLFENDGRGRFSDVTAASGLTVGNDISGPAAAVDVDGDGRLDLFVGNFGDYLAGETPWRAGGARNGQPNRLYRNLGGLRFAEAGAEAGIADTGWAQALSHADLDRDGDQDLYVANDFGPNELLLNDGTGRFTAAGAASRSDDRHHGMNVSFADLNRDRLADLMVTNIWFYDLLEARATETNTLLLSVPDAAGLRYARHEDPRFLGLDTGWSWAAHFFDYDLDGTDDLFIANGFTDYLTFIQKRPHPEIEGAAYPINNGREPNWLLRGDGPLAWEAVDSVVRLDGVNSRSAALLDFDRDGDVDLALSTFHDRARLFRNDAVRRGHWLEIELVGAPDRGINLDAIGAQITVTGDRLHVWRAVTGGEGYLGQSSLTQHFGTGSASEVDVEILWPGGEVERHRQVAVDRRVRIAHGVGLLDVD